MYPFVPEPSVIEPSITGVTSKRRRTSVEHPPMMSASSVLVLFVLALVGATSFVLPTVSLSRALVAGPPSEQEIRSRDARRDGGWQHAMRTESVRPTRSSASARDASAERRERTTSAGPSWVSLATIDAHASRVARLVPCECGVGIHAPGLPASSTRAPPLA